MNNPESAPQRRVNPKPDFAHGDIGASSQAESSELQDLSGYADQTEKAESGELQDLSGQIAQVEKIVKKVVEENQSVALIAAIRLAFFVSSFGSLSWGIALSVDIPADAGWLYYSAIVFFFVASVVFFVLGFIFKITWLEPLRKLIAPVVNWFKRRRRRRD